MSDVKTETLLGARPLSSKLVGDAAFELWRKQIKPIYDVDRVGGSGFHLDVVSWQLPNGFLIESSGSPILLERSEALICNHPFEQISIFRLMEGEVTADYDGREVILGPGDFVFLDYASPSKSSSTFFRAYTLTVPRIEVPLRGRQGALHGAVLRGKEPPGRLLGTQLDALVEGFAALSVLDAELVFSSFIDLAVRLWPAQEEATLNVTLDRAKAIIRNELVRPDLSPTMLAKRLGISRAGLYTAFAPQGGVSAFILAMRLDESLKSLVSERRQGLSVKAVAGRYGFKSVAHFSRAFASRFGRTPTEVIKLNNEHFGGIPFADWLIASGKDHSVEMVRAWLNGHTRLDPKVKHPNEMG